MRLIHLAVSLVVGANCLGIQPSQVESGNPGAPREGPVAFSSSNTTPLRAVIQIARENRVPVGIILGIRPSLCSERSLIKVDAATVQDAFVQAIAGTGYALQLQGGVYVLVAPDTTPHEMTLLNYRFDRFSATDATIGGAGSLLAGYIATVAEGASGFAGDSLYSLSAKRFTIRMEFATTTEIANRIISLDGKGLWVFRPTPGEVQAKGGVAPIRVFGYLDNATALEGLHCNGNPGQDR